MGCKTSNQTHAIEWLHLTLKSWKWLGAVKFPSKVAKSQNQYEIFTSKISINFQYSNEIRFQNEQTIVILCMLEDEVSEFDCYLIFKQRKWPWSVLQQKRGSTILKTSNFLCARITILNWGPYLKTNFFLETGPQNLSYQTQGVSRIKYPTS